MAAMNDSNFSQFLFWNATGDEIQIVDSKAFATRVLPTYFERSSFGPFVKELLRWGFARREPGNGIENAFRHKYFRRDSPDLITLMSFKGRPKTKPSSVIKNMKKVQGAKPPMAKGAHEKVYSEYHHQGDGKNSSQGDTQMLDRSESSGGRRIPPAYPTQYHVDPNTLRHFSQVNGASNQQATDNHNQDASKQLGRFSIPGSTSRSQGLAQNAQMSGTMTDQAYALRLLSGESGVPSGGQSSMDANSGFQHYSQTGSSITEQALRANIDPEHVKAILEMGARQNPLQGVIGLESLMNQGSSVSGFSNLNNTAQNLQNQQNQQYAHYSMNAPAPQTTQAAAPSNLHDFQSTGAPPSELSADINAAIEKEVARRLDSIMSVAANMEIMKEQAKATAHFRMAAASSLQQQQESNAPPPAGISLETLEALEGYRQIKNRMGQNP